MSITLKDFFILLCNLFFPLLSSWHPSIPSTTDLFSVMIVQFAFFRNLYEQNQTVRTLFWGAGEGLASFAQHNYFAIHPCCCLHQWFTCFYCRVVFHCIAILQSADLFSCAEYLCSFQFLATTNKLTMNINVQVFALTYNLIFLGKYLKKNCLNYIQGHVLLFKKTVKWFSKQLNHFILLPAMYESSSYLKSFVWSNIFFFNLAFLIGLQCYLIAV